tara:strand:- start:245 stop:448 length:204 start_codon:yes stop_codon:yes gene_type:complete
MKERYRELREKSHRIEGELNTIRANLEFRIENEDEKKKAISKMVSITNEKAKIDAEVDAIIFEMKYG